MAWASGLPDSRPRTAATWPRSQLPSSSSSNRFSSSRSNSSSSSSCCSAASPAWTPTWWQSSRTRAASGDRSAPGDQRLRSAARAVDSSARDGSGRSSEARATPTACRSRSRSCSASTAEGASRAAAKSRRYLSRNWRSTRAAVAQSAASVAEARRRPRSPSSPGSVAMPRANTGSTLPASGTTPSLGTERTADWPLAAPRSRRDMRMALGRGTWLEERLVSGRRRPGFSPGRTFPRALAPVVRGLTPLPTTGEPMDIGMVGLGRMGGNMALRLKRGGHRVVGYDPGAAGRGAAAELETGGSLEALVAALPATRAIWLMVPAGAPVDATLDLLLPLLQPGDVVVDGGNSNYRDSERRAARCRDAGVHLLDCGTSGGVWGLQEGYSLMVGGDPGAAAR